MKQVHLHGKSFDEADFRRLVIGGQTNADTIRFVVPRRFSDELDFSTDDWVFSISYENKEGQGDTVLLAKSLSSGSEANLYLDWKPSQTATQVSGKLTCQVTAVSKGPDDEVVSRFTCAPFAVYVEDWIKPTPITQTQPTLIEQALEIMAEYNADIQQALESGKIATENAHLSERYAKGTEGGEPVESGPGYQDNAKYYLDLAQEAKTNALDAIDARTTEKKSEIDDYVEDKSKPAIDSYVTAKTTESQQAISAYVEQTSKPAVDAYVEQKQTAFDQHVVGKTGEFNDNASSKTTTFNQNVTTKQNSFNTNATQKTEEAEQAIGEAKDSALAEIQEAVASITLGESAYEVL